MQCEAMNPSRKIAFLTLATPLALAVAACGQSTEDGPPEGDAIAAIPAPEGQQWTEIAAATAEGGNVIGNPEAPLKLVEYASHTCSHCADFSDEASAPMREKYIATGVVSHEIRNLIRDPIDLSIAVLARCSGPQAFHPLAEQAWANFANIIDTVNANQEAYGAAMQSTGGERLQGVAEAAGLVDFFAARGISRDQAMQCLADEDTVTQLVEQTEEQATEHDITGTPTFFLNGRKLNVTTWEALEPILQNAGAR